MKKIYLAATFLLLFIVGSFAGIDSIARPKTGLSLILTASVTQSNVACFGGCNGSATVTPSGGSAPYFYQWSQGPSTPTTCCLCAGVYTVIVTDASSATVAVTFTITQPPPLNLSTSANSTICSGACKTLTASASGGTSPYIYTWQPGNLAGPMQTVCPTSNTTYTLMVYDTYSCSILNTIAVTVASPTANAGPTKSLTCVNPTAVLNGSGVNTYSWSGPGIISGANSPSPTVSSPGVYSLTGTNVSNGCASNTATVMVVMNIASPTVTIVASSNPVCAGTSVTLTANTTANATFSWSTGSNTSTTVVTPTASTSYAVSVYDQNNGCMSSVSQVVGVSTPTIIINTPSVACAGATGCISASGATSYTWTGPCGFSATQPTVCFPFSLACSCSFSVTGSSSNGCIKTVTACINVVSSPTVNIYASDSLICVGQNATLTTSGAASYNWSNSSTGSIVVVSPTVTTNYTVTGTSSAGCPGSAVYTQSVSACTAMHSSALKEIDLSVYPNPFTNTFIIKINASTRVIIYNTLGKEVLSRQLSTGDNTIDLSALPKGIYFIKSGSIFKKVLKE